MNTRKLIGIVQEVALSNFGPSIFPVYRFDHAEEPIHIGTCFAIEFLGRRFLISAAHVLDHKELGSLAVATASGFVDVEGEWHIADPGELPREEDPIDFAWHELTDDEAASLPCIPSLALEDSQGPSAGMRLLSAIGFPASKNKKISPQERKNRRITPKRAQYSNTEIVPKKYFALRGMSAQSHVAMKRERRAIDLNGVEDNTIGHHGFSGGPLIYTGLSNSPVAIGNQLTVGVILEGDESHGVIVALRLSVVLRHIEGQLRA